MGEETKQDNVICTFRMSLVSQPKMLKTRYILALESVVQNTASQKPYTVFQSGLSPIR